MPQISLYIDQETLDKIENAAKREHLSISKWVAEQIRSRVQPTYPTAFENLFGSVEDETFKRPEPNGFESDSFREAL